MSDAHILPFAVRMLCFFLCVHNARSLWSGSAIQEQCICSSAAIISALFQVYFHCAVPCWIKVTAQCSHYTRIHMKMYSNFTIDAYNFKSTVFQNQHVAFYPW